MPRNRWLAVGLTVAVLGTPLVTAADWPGWRGADRTGVSIETGLLKQWPAEGPPLAWKMTGLGEGYSTPSVAGGRIYVMGNKGMDNEYVQAREVADGKEIWTTKVGKVGPNLGPQYPAARSTPTVDGDLLYALGSDGDLACLETATGNVRWKKSLRNDFGGKVGGRASWAYSESPLIDGDVVVSTPGGSEATLVALNKKTGDTVWKGVVPQGDAAAYGSTIVAEGGGVKQYVQVLQGGLVSVAAKDGKFLWRFDKATGNTNCTTAIAYDGHVYSSLGGSGGKGSALLKLTANDGGVTATEVYFETVMKNHHGGVIRVEDYVYGTTSVLVCQDFKTGKIKWQERSVGKGSLAVADGHIYVRSEDGPVALVEVTPDGYKEKGRFNQPDRSRKKSWPHPVVVGGKMYLRDDDLLLCYDVKAK